MSVNKIFTVYVKNRSKKDFFKQNIPWHMFYTQYTGRINTIWRNKLLEIRTSVDKPFSMFMLVYLLTTKKQITPDCKW